MMMSDFIRQPENNIENVPLVQWDVFIFGIPCNRSSPLPLSNNPFIIFMRRLLFLFLLFCCGTLQAQIMPAAAVVKKVRPVDTFQTSFIPHSVIATLSIGFIDGHRRDFKVPVGFERNNTSGFAPVSGKLEYGISNSMSLGLMLGYDLYYGNYYQLYTANGRDYKRYKTDKTDIYSAGLAAYYHFGKIIPIKRLDVFVGVGFMLNTERHSARPQGDSTVQVTERNVSPMLKAGVRYYIANRSSLFADIGYDKSSLFSLGYSCRFMKK